MKMDKVSQAMEKVGIPGRDAYDLPTSPKRFPDGAVVPNGGLRRGATQGAGGRH